METRVRENREGGKKREREKGSESEESVGVEKENGSRGVVERGDERV